MLPLEFMALAECPRLVIHRSDKSRVDEARCGLENDAHAFGSIVRKPEHKGYVDPRERGATGLGLSPLDISRQSSSF